MPDDIHIPEAGDALKVEDLNLIVDKIVKRQELYPNESIKVSVGVVLFNIGDMFAPIHCIKGEWRGIKANLIPDGDIPKCPNGHVLLQGDGLRLGWAAPPPEGDKLMTYDLSI